LAKKKKNKSNDATGLTRDTGTDAAVGRVARYGSFVDDIRRDRGLWFIIFFGIVLVYLLRYQGGSIDLAKSPQWAFRALAFGGLLIFGILDAKRIRESISKVNLFGVLPISLLILMVASNVVSIRPFETVEETMNILAYASLAFLCYVYINNLQRLRQFVEVIVVAGFVVAFNGLYLFYGALWGRGETTPLSSWFYWHNPCAGFLLLVWPVMLAQFYSLRRGWHVFLILYIFFITFTAFGLTLSRGGWLAGMIPFLGIPFVLSRKRIMVSWRPIVLVVLYFLSAIPFVLKYRGKFFQPIIDRFNQIRWDDYSVVGRFEFWDIAVKVFKEHPIFGIGFNTFGYYYVHYQTDPQYYTKDPHSLYLRFLVEGGIVGVIFVLSFLAVIFNLVKKTLSVGSDKMLTVYRVGLLTGICGELLHMALDFDWTFPIIPLLLVCQVAVVARTFTYPKAEQELAVTEWEPDLLKDVSEDIEDEIINETVPRRSFFVKHLWIWLLLAGFGFTINVLGFTSMKYYEMGKDLVYNRGEMARNQAVEEMGQLEREAIRSQTQEIPTFNEVYGDIWAELGQKGKDYWHISLKYNPWNWYPLNDLINGHFYHGSRLIESGMEPEARESLEEGLTYADGLLRVTPYRPASHYYVGMMQIMLADVTGDDAMKEAGLAHALKALELDPKNIPRYYLGIGEYYYDEGDYENALKYLEQIEEIFVPRYDTGDIDFNGLKGKSGARLDWRMITETLREAWALESVILLDQGKKEEALIALGNGLDTPLGTGEIEQAIMLVELPEDEIQELLIEYEDDRDAGREAYEERQVDIYYKQLQLPFALIIADISSELGDWVTVKRRATHVLSIMESLGVTEAGELDRAEELLAEADQHLLSPDYSHYQGATPDETENPVDEN